MSPANAMRPGPRPTSMPSFILFYPSLWPEHTNVIDKSDRTDSSAIAWGEQMLSDSCLPVLSVTLVYRGQTAGWIKMPLGTEVGVDPGDIVLDGDPAPPPQKKGRGQSPGGSLAMFIPCVL